MIQRCYTFGADIVSLSPSSDIPDRVVKGRGALLARKKPLLTGHT